MDELNSIQQTSDGGYILGGWSYSNISGDKTEVSQGVTDYWVVKLDASGDIMWQNTIGGGSHEELNSVQQTIDGGYILCGFSQSDIYGDKTENSQGGSDYWIVKLDELGNVSWQNTIGGNHIDVLNSIQQTIDGGYILGGWSYSNISGDKAENRQGSVGNDYWVLKLDAIGNITWQNTIGGNGKDELYSIRQTVDGGYILGGWSHSNISGDKTEASQGVDDYWVVKLDASGDILWQNTIGGNSTDWLSSIQQTIDGGYILGGISASNISGDKTENSQGGQDYWIVKLDADGNISWQNTIGGNGSEVFNSIQQNIDGGYILGGYSNSNISGDKTENSQGGFDYWVVKLDASGNILWQNTIGGSSSDWLSSVQQTSDGGYILAGSSNSEISNDKIENSLGGLDYWVVKLAPEIGCLASGIAFYTQAEIDAFPTNYPGCTQILGDVTISDGDITNLNGLSSIISIEGQLSIYYNGLTSFEGLNNLASIGGGIELNGAYGLTSFQGLNSVCPFSQQC